MLKQALVQLLISVIFLVYADSAVQYLQTKGRHRRQGIDCESYTGQMPGGKYNVLQQHFHKKQRRLYQSHTVLAREMLWPATMPYFLFNGALMFLSSCRHHSSALQPIWTARAAAWLINVRKIGPAGTRSGSTPHPLSSPGGYSTLITTTPEFLGQSRQGQCPTSPSALAPSSSPPPTALPQHLAAVRSHQTSHLQAAHNITRSMLALQNMTRHR